MQFDGHSSLLEALSVVKILVDEQVQIADRQVGGRQASQVRGAGGRGIRRDLVRADRVAQVGTPADQVGLPVPHPGIGDGVTGSNAD